MKKLALILLFPALSTFAQIEMGGVDIQGDMSILDNPDTPVKEGNLTVENNALVNGELRVGKINRLYDLPLAIQLDGIVSNGKSGIAIGPNSRVLSSYSLAIGDTAKAEGNYAFALGLNAQTTQAASAALGANTMTLAPNSIAMGAGSSTEGEASLASGLNSKTQGRASQSLGYVTTAESFSQVTVGSMNEIYPDASTTKWVETDPIFVVGNGNGAKRSNAMVVLKNGDLIVNGVIRSTKVSDALPMGEFGPEEEANSEEIQTQEETPVQPQSTESAIEAAVPEIE